MYTRVKVGAKKHLACDKKVKLNNEKTKTFLSSKNVIFEIVFLSNLKSHRATL
jgi:hypothetical protein